MNEFEKHVEEVNSATRNFRSENVRNIIVKVKSVNNDVKNTYSLVKPQPETKREEKLLDLQTADLWKNIHSSYINNQGRNPVGTVEEACMPNGEQRITVYTQNGSIIKSHYPISDDDKEAGIFSDITYEGYSMVDVKGNGADKLLYSVVTVRESNNTPKVNVSGVMRDEYGKFTNFDMNASSTSNLYSEEFGDEVEKRFVSLENTFNEAYKEFTANAEEEQAKETETKKEVFSEETKAEDVFSIQTESQNQQKNIFQKITGKVKDFFEPCFGEDGDW